MRRPIEQDEVVRRIIERALACKRMSNQWIDELAEVHPTIEAVTWQTKFSLSQEYAGKYRSLIWAAKIAAGTVA